MFRLAIIAVDGLVGVCSRIVDCIDETIDGDSGTALACVVELSDFNNFLIRKTVVMLFEERLEFLSINPKR